MNNQVTIVGIGGVGSWIAEFLARAGVSVHVVDGDKVEKKNLKYSNYVSSDIGISKTYALRNKVVKMGAAKPSVEIAYLENIEGDNRASNLVILCVDSIMARIQLISSLKKIKGIKWMDCRAEGRNYQIFTHKSKLIKSFLGSKKPTIRRGCQPNIEEIEAGNLMCAAKATQMALDMLRNKPYSAEVLKVETI